ncbi:MAG TPA: ATP-binding protein [Streptomyces sp.]
MYARDVPEPVIDDAALILSELLSNSCRHARPLGDDRDDRGFGSGNGIGGVGGGVGVGVDVGVGAGVGGRENVDGGGATGQAGAKVPGEPLEGGIRAAWSIGGDGLLVLEVTDGGGPTRPRPSSPSLTAHGGRGLGIVASLALRWGVRDTPGEVTVWAQLPVRGRHARRDDPPTGIGLPMGVPLDLPLDLAESLDDLG